MYHHEADLTQKRTKTQNITESEYTKLASYSNKPVDLTSILT